MTARSFRKTLPAFFAALCLLLSACSTSIALPTSQFLLSFDTFEELCASIGYQMVRFDGAYIPSAYNSIEGTMGQITYKVGEAEMQLRMEPGEAGDITGVGQVTYKTTDVNGVDLHVGSFQNIDAAWFVHDNFSYALTATNMNMDIFESTATMLAEALTSTAS